MTTLRSGPSLAWLLVSPKIYHQTQGPKDIRVHKVTKRYPTHTKSAIFKGKVTIYLNALNTHVLTGTTHASTQWLL